MAFFSNAPLLSNFMASGMRVLQEQTWAFSGRDLEPKHRPHDQALYTLSLCSAVSGQLICVGPVYRKCSTGSVCKHTCQSNNQ